MVPKSFAFINSRYPIISLNDKFGKISVFNMTQRQKPVDPDGDFILQLEFSLYRVHVIESFTAEQHQNGIGDFLNVLFQFLCQLFFLFCEQSLCFFFGFFSLCLKGCILLFLGCFASS